jgi:hypothetical protein
VKHCLLCVHCDYSGGSYGYSEMTPGSDASLFCEKGVMRHAKRRNLFMEAWSRQQLREALTTAEDCPHYRPEAPCPT